MCVSGQPHVIYFTCDKICIDRFCPDFCKEKLIVHYIIRLGLVVNTGNFIHLSPHHSFSSIHVINQRLHLSALIMCDTLLTKLTGVEKCRAGKLIILHVLCIISAELRELISVIQDGM